MSEPIQSISQGNYVLTTDKEVSHDNTLSGNGTVNSPLGVVPGYNETVLWSGNGNISTFTLSEKLSKFERFRIVFQGYNTPQSGFCEDYSPPDGSNISYCYQHYVANSDSNPLQIWAGRFSTTDSLTYNLVEWKWMCMPGNSHTWANDWNNNSRKPIIRAVIGINRIANN